MLKKMLFLAALALLANAGQAGANSGIWRELPAEGALALRGAADSGERRYEADNLALRSQLDLAPHEASRDMSRLLPIPMPDGSIARFSVLESPIMEPGLAARFPEIRTYRVVGVDDPSAAGRISIGPLGLHGMLQTAAGRVVIAPEDFRSQNSIYRSSLAARQRAKPYSCGVDGHSDDLSDWVEPRQRIARRTPDELLVYRIAVAVTYEYYQYFGGSVANTTNAIVATINQVNSVYQRDLGIKLVPIANNNLLYETSPNGPIRLDNDDEFALLQQANDFIDGRLNPNADGKYDIGHIFSAPNLGGGIAFLGAACDDDIKAGGVSGIASPDIGNAFDIDLVAHEIGHQLNADHSFNGTTSACSNRYGPTAYEPGSGSTIMSYSGICGAENLQDNSDAHFHAGSIAQIKKFTDRTATCYSSDTLTYPGNRHPQIAAIGNSVIPANTPFLLEASAPTTDPDLDSLTYQWDQMNTGCPTDSSSFGTDNGSNPLFRSYFPRAEAWRNFPALGTQLENRYDRAEVLPCHDRELKFRLTARDGNSGQDIEGVRVTVTDAAGPFRVTAPNLATILPAGTPFDVEWDVANTDRDPVNCSAVDIDLLTFSANYLSYSVYSLATMVPNTDPGIASVTINPATASHPRARLRVKCSDNIFYDISNTDITVQATGGPTPLDDTMFTTRSYADVDLTRFVPPACGPVVDCTPVANPVLTGGSDSSAIDLTWLLLLSGLVALVKLYRRYGLQ